LGSLGPGERRDVEAHLVGCAPCRDELASYAALPGLLSRLELDEARGGLLLPPPTLLPAALAAVEAERSGRHRQLFRWRLATAGLVGAAAVTGVLVLTTGPPATAPGRPLVAATGVAATGSATVQARPWGTELRLRLQDLPAADGYEAYAVDKAGVRTLAASWGPTGDGRADVPAASGLSPTELASLVVQTRSGAELLVFET